MQRLTNFYFISPSKFVFLIRIKRFKVFARNRHYILNLLSFILKIKIELIDVYFFI